jgi:hypothetical protein
MPKHFWAHAALLAANIIYGANYTIAKEVMPALCGSAWAGGIAVSGCCAVVLVGRPVL